MKKKTYHEKEIELVEVEGSIDGEELSIKVPRLNDSIPEWNKRTKLIKQIDDEILYWVVWLEESSLVIHSGTVGNIVGIKEIQLSLPENGEKELKELINGKIKDGFRFLEEDDLTLLLVTYRYESDEIEKTHEKRQYAEAIISRCLLFTGNGYCDGGGIGMGVTEIFNYVIEVEKAVNEIIEELENENLIQGVEISYYDAEADGNIILFPLD